MRAKITNKMELYQLIDKKQRRLIRWLPLFRFKQFVKGAFWNEKHSQR